MKKKPDFWTFKNEADSKEAELLIYGEISPNAEFWHAILPDDPMVSAKELQQDLRDLGGKDLTLRINSPGGDVFQAQAIYNLLKVYTGKIHCHIDGICASAATLVASAADDVVMPANALYMIHNPMMCFGDQTLTRDDLAKCIEQMDKTKDTLLNVYSDRCGDALTRDEIARMMDEETWMTAQEALDNGFVDSIDGYGVSASVSGGGVMVNNVLMASLDPSRVRLLKQLCEKNEVKEPMTTTNDAGIMDRLKAFLDGQDKTAEAAQKAEAEADRVKALDALKGDNSMVNTLVETGKANGATAEQLKPYVDAVAAVKVENKTLDELKALITDQMQSGAAGVKASTTEPVPAAQDDKAEVDNIVNLVNKKRG